MFANTETNKPPYTLVKCSTVPEMQAVVDFVRPRGYNWTVSKGCGPYIELDKPGYEGCHSNDEWMNQHSKEYKIISFSEFEKQYLGKTTINQYGLKVGDKLSYEVMDAWSGHGYNAYYENGGEIWKKDTTGWTSRHPEGREITGFKELKGVVGALISGTDAYYLRAEGFAEFRDNFGKEKSAIQTSSVSSSELTVLPEKWYIVPKTRDEAQIIGRWFDVRNHNDPSSFYERNGKVNTAYVAWRGTRDVYFDVNTKSILDEGTQITFDQFKRWVLKQNDAQPLPTETSRPKFRFEIGQKVNVKAMAGHMTAKSNGTETGFITTDNHRGMTINDHAVSKLKGRLYGVGGLWVTEDSIEPITVSTQVLPPTKADLLLEEAKRRYPKGTKYKSAGGSSQSYTVTEDDVWQDSQKLITYGTDCIGIRNKGFVCFKGIWAEIISVPATIVPPKQKEVMERYVKVINSGAAYTTHTEADRMGVVNYDYSHLPREGDTYKVVREELHLTNSPSYILKSLHGKGYIVGKSGCSPSTKAAYEAQKQQKYTEAYGGVTLDPFFKPNSKPDEFKVGDWVTIVKSVQSGDAPRFLGKTFKIDRMDKNHLGDPYVVGDYGDHGGVYTSEIRHATRAEIAQATGQPLPKGIHIHKGQAIGPSAGYIGIDVETAPLKSWMDEVERMQGYYGAMQIKPRQFGRTSDLANLIIMKYPLTEKESKKSSAKRNPITTLPVKLQKPQVIKSRAPKTNKLITL